MCVHQTYILMTSLVMQLFYYILSDNIKMYARK